MAGDDRLFITDVNGRICEIPSIAGLDARSRRELARVL
jgi:hypothetical protein